MDKTQLVAAIRVQLEKDLSLLKEAAIATYQAATHEESKPENEYDTRGLEASYLAGAQAKRVAEIEGFLTTLKYLKVASFNSKTPIASTALVQVEHEDKTSWVFVLPIGGGLTLEFANQTIQIVTPSSPLGDAIIGLQKGDVAFVEVGNQVREYEILNVE